MTSFGILHVGTEKQWRGGEKQIYLLAREMKRQGFESHIAYPKNAMALKKFQEVASVCSLPTSSAVDPRSILALRNYCANNQIDIIDAHSSNAMSLALGVKSLLPDLKLVVHRRVAFPIKKNFFSLRKYKSSKVNQYVGISKAICNILIEAGIDENHVTCVPSAVDPSGFENLHRDQCHQNMRYEQKLDQDWPILGMTSALTNEKGHETILWALSRIQEKAYYLVAGYGPEKEKLRMLAKSLRLEDRVRFLGHLDDTRPFLKSLDIFLMPSRFEGLGTSVLDAMSAGIFVIASNTGGLPEMVVDHETGLLAEVGDQETWGQNISLALRDFDLRARCISAAKKHIETNFSLESMVNGNLEVYRRLLAKR